MRQIFRALPWIHPAEPPELQRIYRAAGRRRRVAKHEVIKHGGEEPRLFFLEKGLCAYWVAGDARPSPSVLSLIIPGRTMSDITCFSGDRVNVLSRALRPSVIWEVSRAEMLRRFLADSQLLMLVSQHLMRKQESHIEGMVANFTLPAEARLRVLLRVLFAAYGLSPRGERNIVPLLLSNAEMGAIVNLSRMSVYRILAGWLEQDLISRSGKTLLVSSRLFDGLYDWDHGAFTAHDREGYGPDAVVS